MEEGSLNNWGDGHTAHLFSWQKPPAINAVHYKTARVLPGEFKGNTLNTTNDRMSGTLIVADQPRISYLTSCLLRRGKGKSLVSAVQLQLSCAWLSQSSGDPLDQGGAADLSETGMFDLVEVPFFRSGRAQEQRGEQASIDQYR